jgi:hypothetical protein
VRDCANCHTRNTPEWRRGPSGQRDLCNSCGLRWAKQVRLFYLVSIVTFINIFIRLVGFLHAILHAGLTQQMAMLEARSTTLPRHHCIKNCQPTTPKRKHLRVRAA